MLTIRHNQHKYFCFDLLQYCVVEGRKTRVLHPRAAAYVPPQLRTYTRTTLRKQAVNTLRHSSLLIYFRVAKPL